ncbi:Metal-dependent hydrolase, endonuclease/exonuclease/phosphatase family [Glycomyces sambucus]|uniref:Metal-dependent hydrolase, endonuclease/exonuclease/phosphatase family n=1 Tax=Glycomyces sambucus TaxID=380244 RepID=A0A1G9LZR7_9ACTN|nr:endonuclease/exonuclease/phosphatase family protein [Glycomyces sambucus]SDL67167.1 Metal-dependent hydrolase, endonuclease/exonuclease/phosphatase family [Glycomyces sambucus]
MTETDTAAATDERPRPGERARRPWWRSRWLRALSWAGTAGVAAYTLVRLLGLETGWLLVTTVAFVPYAAIGALAAAGIQAAVRHWAALAATGACALALGAVLLPRVVEDAPAEAAGTEFTVMSVNLYVGQTDLERVVDLVEEHAPDLLSVQELTPGAADRLAELGLGDLLPHSILEPDDLAVGTGLYAAHPIERIDTVGREGIFYQIGAEVDLGGEAVRFMAVHTAAPASRERIPLWEEDFADMPRPDGGAPWILAGDFNATLDHDNMRGLLADGYTDAAEALGEGLTPTWQPTSDGYFGFVKIPPVTLDHVLAEDGVAVLDWEVLGKGGSDHAPVLARLQLP